MVSKRDCGEWAAWRAAMGTAAATQAVKEGEPEIEQVSAREVYNILQDFHALFIVLDVRGSIAFNHARIDGALQPGPSPQGQVLQSFSYLNIQTSCPQPFTVCLCCQGAQSKEDAREAVARYKAAAEDLKPFEAKRFLAFEFQECQREFPFIVTSFQGFEASRLYPSNISERLFLAHWSLASDPFVVKSCLQVTHVVNCTVGHPFCFEEDGIKYFRVPVQDEQAQNLLPHLGGAVAFVKEALESGGVVLLHCKHGQSRSASVAAACLISLKGWTLEESMAHLQACRPRVRPNAGFLAQLRSFEAGRTPE